MIKWLNCFLDYAERNNIVLNIGEKSVSGDSPLLKAIHTNNYEIVYLFLKFAENNNIILNMNEKSESNDFPLLNAIKHNNIKIIELLIDYANEIHYIF